VITLLCHGCPVQAIVAAFGLRVPPRFLRKYTLRTLPLRLAF
jgi:hypothetical protein